MKHLLLLSILLSIASINIVCQEQNNSENSSESPEIYFDSIPEDPSRPQKQQDSSSKSLVFPEGEYRTPRAGEALKGTLFGIEVDVPARDRTNTAALNIGTAIYAPEVGERDIVPFAAFYYTNGWAEQTRRLRMVLAGVSNDIRFYEGSWNNWGLEFAFTFENYTLPITTKLEIDGEEIDGSEILWGEVRAGAGLGWRIPVYPGHSDNDFTFHVLYEPGYLYFDDADEDTADNYVLPDETYESRIHLRLRFDAIERNIMEMAHIGWAMGVDLIFGRRHNWDDHDFNGSFLKDDTQDYEKLTGFITMATGVPLLSERHRLIFSLHGGTSLTDSLDRYSAFRLGGGPEGDESEALARSPIPGERFNEFLSSRYGLLTIEYRLELLFFFYLHVRGVVGVIRRAEFDEDLGEYDLDENEVVGSIGFGATTGFIWDSQISFEYVNDQGVKGRDGNDGHNFLIRWSKSF